MTYQLLWCPVQSVLAIPLEQARHIVPLEKRFQLGHSVPQESKSDLGRQVQRSLASRLLEKKKQTRAGFQVCNAMSKNVVCACEDLQQRNVLSLQAFLGYITPTTCFHCFVLRWSLMAFATCPTMFILSKSYCPFSPNVLSMHGATTRPDGDSPKVQLPLKWPLMSEINCWSNQHKS